MEIVAGEQMTEEAIMSSCGRVEMGNAWGIQ